MQTYQNIMATRRAINESIQFETPGSDEYNKLQNEIKRIDSGNLKPAKANEFFNENINS